MSVNPTLQNPAFLGNQDFTWWLGTVANADDKDAKVGRCRVNILGFHSPDEKPEDLPWALVMQPTTNAAVSGVGNAANQLKPGSFVMGFFLDYPDCQQPVIMGSFYNQVKGIFEPGTQQDRDHPGAVNKISEQLSETGQPQYSENTVPSASSTFGVSTDASLNQVADNLSGTGALKAPDVVAAQSLPASPSNPSGNLGANSVANGKDGPVDTIVEEIKRCIEGLGNIFKTGKIYQPNKANPVLTKDVGKEDQYIPVSNIDAFPPTGQIKIGSETIGYNGKNEYSLVLVKRGMSQSTPAKYTKGTKVTFIHRTDAPYELVGKFTDKVVDLKGAIDSCLQIIRNLIWYIVNQVKSWLMKKVTEILNAIGLASSNPIPYFVKTLTEVIIQILKTIGCTLDEALVDAIMGGIEGFIEGLIDNLINQLLAMTDEFLSFVEQCINDVFGSIFQITSIATQIADAIEGIVSLIETAGSLGGATFFDENGMVNADALASVGNIVSFILNLLGIGCNRTTDSPLQISWDECNLTQNNCNPFNFVVTGTIPGKWNPEYSKISMTRSESGHTIIMDDTPYNKNLIIQAGGSQTGFHVTDNGDIRVTNSNNKTEVTFGKQHVTIKGDAYYMVKGNYHLKVGGDYHLEVDGKYNVWANRESKVTYNGEHETVYKNDGKLSAANGLAIAASKLGLTASGQCDLFAPSYSTFCTEQNHLCTGSYNRFALYDNKMIGLNTFKFMGGFRNVFRAGVNMDWGVGKSDLFQAAAENVWKGGLYNENILGVSTENKLSIANKNIFGVKTENLKSISFKDAAGLDLGSFSGAKFKNIAGLKFDSGAGLVCRTSGALTMDQ